MEAYHQHLAQILEHGTDRADRTGVGTRSLFGLHARYNLAEGFPAITTKKLVWKSMVSELLWFVSGSGNIEDLKSIYKFNKLWDLNYQDYLKRHGLDPENSDQDGDMGRVYGQQWRFWRKIDGSTVDQLQEAIRLIRNNPDSRRIIVNAWNPGEIDPKDVALPPCHSFFQFYVADGKLSLQMYQRSADMFLGVPLNIASYSLLLHMVARVTNLEPAEFIHSIGDAHIYLDAKQQCEEQLQRESFPLPELHIEDRGQQEIDDFVMEDFALLNYQCHEAIKAKMAV